MCALPTFQLSSFNKSKNKTETLRSSPPVKNYKLEFVGKDWRSKGRREFPVDRVNTIQVNTNITSNNPTIQARAYQPLIQRMPRDGDSPLQIDSIGGIFIIFVCRPYYDLELESDYKYRPQPLDLNLDPKP